MNQYFNLVVIIALSVVLAGCNTTSIGISNNSNPPPTVAFSEYRNFSLNELTMRPPYAGQEINEKAKIKLKEELDLRLTPILDDWNSAADSRSSSRGTLLIEPEIKEIKYISGKSRFWGGALTGDSAIVLVVKYKDKESGEIISNAEFYQHANAYGAAWSIGGTDKAMLNRIAGLFTQFTINNFDKAVGGPTGKPIPGE